MRPNKTYKHNTLSLKNKSGHGFPGSNLKGQKMPILTALTCFQQATHGKVWWQTLKSSWIRFKIEPQNPSQEWVWIVTKILKCVFVDGFMCSWPCWLSNLSWVDFREKRNSALLLQLPETFIQSKSVCVCVSSTLISQTTVSRVPVAVASSPSSREADQTLKIHFWPLSWRKTKKWRSKVKPTCQLCGVDHVAVESFAPGLHFLLSDLCPSPDFSAGV